MVPTDAPAKPRGKRPSEIEGAIVVYLRQRGTGMKRNEPRAALSSDRTNGVSAACETRLRG